MSDWITVVTSLAGGLGLGTLITTFLNNRYDNKKLVFSERMKAYIGLLEALKNAVAKSDEKNRQAFTYWQKRVELVAPSAISEMSKKLYSNRGEDQLKIRDDLIKMMRADLKF